jgi:hypothetical protein
MYFHTEKLYILSYKSGNGHHVYMTHIYKYLQQKNRNLKVSGPRLKTGIFLKQRIYNRGISGEQLVQCTSPGFSFT